MTDPPSASPSVLEWGPGRPGPVAWWRRIDRRAAPVLAGLGAVAVFGSLVGEWQVTDIALQGTGSEEQSEQALAGLTAIGAWGVGWIMGVLALGTCAGLALLGHEGLRLPARSAGLAVAATLLGVVVAASIDLGGQSVLDYRLSGITGLPSGLADLEVSLGRGLYAAYAGLALLAAAMWSVRPPASGAEPAGTVPAHPPAEPAVAGPPGGPPADPAAATPGTAPPVTSTPPDPAADSGPADLTVAPAEPFARPTEGHEWR